MNLFNRKKEDAAPAVSKFQDLFDQAAATYPVGMKMVCVKWDDGCGRKKPFGAIGEIFEHAFEECMLAGDAYPRGYAHIKVDDEYAGLLRIINSGSYEHGPNKVPTVFSPGRGDWIPLDSVAGSPYEKMLEEAKHPTISFKIRKKEGRPAFTVWFSHSAYMRGQYLIVNQKANNGEDDPYVCDTIEEARGLVELLKKRTHPLDLRYFERQYEDVEGEFYTVEDVQ